MLYYCVESPFLVTRAEPTRIKEPRWGLPREVGDTVAFLASDEASYISGQNICVNGPTRWHDRRPARQQRTPLALRNRLPRSL